MLNDLARLEREGELVVVFFRDLASGSLTLHEVPPFGKIPREAPEGSELLCATGLVDFRPYPVLLDEADAATIAALTAGYTAHFKAKWDEAWAQAERLKHLPKAHRPVH